MPTQAQAPLDRPKNAQWQTHCNHLWIDGCFFFGAETALQIHRSASCVSDFDGLRWVLLGMDGKFASPLNGETFELVVRVSMPTDERYEQHLQQTIMCRMVQNNAKNDEDNIISVNLAQNGILVQGGTAKRYALHGSQNDVMKYLKAMLVFQHCGKVEFVIANDGAVVRPDIGPDDMDAWDTLLVGQLHIG